MSNLLYRLGHFAFHRRMRVLVAWLIIVALSAAGAAIFAKGTANDFTIPGTESQSALDTLNHTFPEVAGTSAQVLIATPNGESIRSSEYRAPIERFITKLDSIDDVSQVLNPYQSMVHGAINAKGDAAIVTAQLSIAQTAVTTTLQTQLRDEGATLQRDLPSGSVVSVGGQAMSSLVPSFGPTESLGIVIAFIVLLLVFRSVLSALMPLISAVLGIAVTALILYFTTGFITVSSTALPMALMIGLAVGIDYSLFIISRHRDELSQGVPPEEAAGRAIATAGSAVVFAGITVAVALLGLAVAGIPFLSIMGVMGALAVVVAVSVSLTLTPAFLGFAGARITPKPSRRRMRRMRREQRADSNSEANHGAVTESVARHHRFATSWVSGIMRRPILTIAAVVVVVGVAIVPALELRLTLPNAGTQPLGSDSRDTYDLIDDHFGAGYNGPLLVEMSVLSSTDPVGDVNRVADMLRTVDGVASVPVATPNSTGVTAIVQVVPKTGPSDQATSDLVARIRGMHGQIERETGLSIAVTGFTALGIDVSAKLAASLLPFGALVVGLCLVLLMVVFRSIAVPIKAAVGYLFSLVAAFGATVVVFQWGYGANLLQVSPTGPVISFLPIILMGVLFGLAMDYEVFLVSRIRESYVHGATARSAIKHGFVTSSQVVVAAATIMFFVFVAFIPDGDFSIKPLALSLAVGVFVDAFLVRMTLVPAVLSLLGDAAWWLPKGLAKRLPSIDIEGEGLAKELALADWPKDGPFAIAADDLGLDRSEGLTGAAFDDVHIRVRPGGTLLLHGRLGSGKTALLYTLAGRLSPDRGLLKVCDLGLPERRATVRRHVSVVPLSSSMDWAEVVSSALAAHPQVLFIDDLDAIVSTEARSACVDQLLAAQARAAHTRTPLTLVVSAQGPEVTLPYPWVDPQRVELQAIGQVA